MEVKIDNYFNYSFKLVGFFRNMILFYFMLLLVYLKVPLLSFGTFIIEYF